MSGGIAEVGCLSLTEHASLGKWAFLIHFWGRGEDGLLGPFQQRKQQNEGFLQ